MNFSDLTGLKALITGGNRGIGKAVAASLKQAGANIIITGTNEQALAEAAAELGAVAIRCDMHNVADIENLAQQTGAVDILVNNAGITRDMLFSRQTQDQWDEVLRINTDAPVRLSRLLLPHMAEKGFGRIVNITSVVAHMGNVGQTNYVTAKAALTGFTKALSKEVARKGVTVNAVAPGFITTDMTSKLPEKVVDQFKTLIPAQRFGEPSDIAAAVRFLASREAGYITGTTVHVNGGLYLA